MTLFAMATVSTHHNGLAGQLRKDVAQLTLEQVEDTAAAVDAVMPRLMSRMPRLQADQATFKTEGQADGKVLVRVVVPVVGDVKILTLRPDNLREDARPPVGDVNGLDIGPREPAVAIANQFASGASADQVKAWAREHLRSVQEWLDVIGHQMEGVSRQLRALATELVVARARALSAAARLSDELGTGL